MSTVVPQSEMTKKAIAWVSQTRTECPEKSLDSLLQEAAMRFNLGPKDVQFLQNFFKKQD